MCEICHYVQNFTSILNAELEQKIDINLDEELLQKLAKYCNQSGSYIQINIKEKNMICLHGWVITMSRFFLDNYSINELEDISNHYIWNLNSIKFMVGLNLYNKRMDDMVALMYLSRDLFTWDKNEFNQLYYIQYRINSQYNDCCDMAFNLRQFYHNRYYHYDDNFCKISLKKMPKLLLNIINQLCYKILRKRTFNIQTIDTYYKLRPFFIHKENFVKQESKLFIARARLYG